MKAVQPLFKHYGLILNKQPFSSQNKLTAGPFVRFTFWHFLYSSKFLLFCVCPKWRKNTIFSLDKHKICLNKKEKVLIKKKKNGFIKKFRLEVELFSVLYADECSRIKRTSVNMSSRTPYPNHSPAPSVWRGSSGRIYTPGIKNIVLYNHHCAIIRTMYVQVYTSGQLN